MSETKTIVTGGCLCGDVRFSVSGPLRDVVVCHCRMCRKAHGHIGACTAVPKDSLALVEARGFRWYRSSAGVRRGFCGACDSTLFWDADRRNTISIAAGTLDAPTGLRTTLQIHVASASDYYDVGASFPVRPE